MGRKRRNSSWVRISSHKGTNSNHQGPAYMLSSQLLLPKGLISKYIVHPIPERAQTWGCGTLGFLHTGGKISTQTF